MSSLQDSVRQIDSTLGGAFIQLQLPQTLWEHLMKPVTLLKQPLVIFIPRRLILDVSSTLYPEITPHSPSVRFTKLFPVNLRPKFNF